VRAAIDFLLGKLRPNGLIGDPQTDNRYTFGHWHYTYLYYSQVVYREGGEAWREYRDRLSARIVRSQQPDGSWTGQIGPVYVTSLNLIMLLLDKGLLPIYQR
jgi:hypothetical protein